MGAGRNRIDTLEFTDEDPCRVVVTVRARRNEYARLGRENVAYSVGERVHHMVANNVRFASVDTARKVFEVNTVNVHAAATLRFECVIHLVTLTEGFYDTAVAMPYKFELRRILPTERVMNK